MQARGVRVVNVDFSLSEKSFLKRVFRWSRTHPNVVSVFLPVLPEDPQKNSRWFEMGLVDDLDGFIGSAVFQKHALFPLTYTEGIHYLAERAGAFWLIDLVGSWQFKHKHVPFQLWRLEVDEKHRAVATMREDSGEPELARQEIPYADFPLSEFEFYVVDGVMMLKNEY